MDQDEAAWNAAEQKRKQARKLRRQKEAEAKKKELEDPTVRAEKREAALKAAAELDMAVEAGKLSLYDVSKAIGKGKFSIVYRAKRKADSKPVKIPSRKRLVPPHTEPRAAAATARRRPSRGTRYCCWGIGSCFCCVLIRVVPSHRCVSPPPGPSRSRRSPFST